MNADPHPFATLSPERVIDAVESTGRLSDLRVFALNSYENRVYQIGIENAEPLIVKFYRPERWSDAQILEEHHFSLQMAEAELPVVPPLADDAGATLFTHEGFRFALFQRRGGHAPELDDPDTQLMLGRLLARMHAVGAREAYAERPALDVKSFGRDSMEYIAEHAISADLRMPYVSLCEDLLKRIEPVFAAIKPKLLRTHSDCHRGNIISRDHVAAADRWHFVDLDDSRMTPAIQDIWMLLSGDRFERTAQLNEILEGYNEFADFSLKELALVEPLRTLRLMHHAAWIARRWSDPAFPLAFTWFGNGRYWADHILELREQLAALDEPPLTVY
jgi:Ser/Thr protein kinase RdoA (MazF antagonist)